MSKETVLAPEQIDSILDSPGNIDYVIADKRERYHLFARAIEAAVLESDKVKEWKKDAERYRWLRDNSGEDDSIADIFVYDEAWGVGHLDSQIDAAKESNHD